VIRANLEDGDMTVTACVVKGVQTMCVTKITEDVRASLDTGDLIMDLNVTVSTCVVKGVRLAIPLRVSATNASKTLTMEINANTSALITASPPQTAAAVTTKETVCMDVSTALQVSTVKQVGNVDNFHLIITLYYFSILFKVIVTAFNIIYVA